MNDNSITDYIKATNFIIEKYEELGKEAFEVGLSLKLDCHSVKEFNRSGLHYTLHVINKTNKEQGEAYKDDIFKILDFFLGVD